MTMPDARFLVRLSDLHRAPVGAPAWWNDSEMVVLGYWHDGTVSLANASWVGESVSLHGPVPPHAVIHPKVAARADEVFLDFTAPKIVDGIEVRLDMLRWAVPMLRWLTPPRRTRFYNRWSVGGAGSHLTPPITVRPPYEADEMPVGTAFILDPFPKLSGLSEDEQVRVITAAALRQEFGP